MTLDQIVFILWFSATVVSLAGALALGDLTLLVFALIISGAFLMWVDAASPM